MVKNKWYDYPIAVAQCAYAILRYGLPEARDRAEAELSELRNRLDKSRQADKKYFE